MEFICINDGLNWTYACTVPVFPSPLPSNSHPLSGPPAPYICTLWLYQFCEWEMTLRNEEWERKWERIKKRSTRSKQFHIIILQNNLRGHNMQVNNCDVSLIWRVITVMSSFEGAIMCKQDTSGLFFNHMGLVNNKYRYLT